MELQPGIPATVFVAQDIHAEVQRLKTLSVQFRGEPTELGPVITVIFEDTCGNLLQLVQTK